MKLNVKNQNVDPRFLELAMEVYEKNAGHETYGDMVEFYDEDGAVLMTAQEIPGGKVRFTFYSGEVFDETEVRPVA